MQTESDNLAGAMPQDSPATLPAALSPSPFFYSPLEGGRSHLPILYEKFELASFKEPLQEAPAVSAKGSHFAIGSWLPWGQTSAVAPLPPLSSRLSLAVSEDGHFAAVICGGTVTVMDCSSDMEEIIGSFSALISGGQGVHLRVWTEAEAEGSGSALQYATWSEDGELLVFFSPSRNTLCVLDKNAQIVQSYTRTEWRKKGAVAGIAIRSCQPVSSKNTTYCYEVLVVTRNAALLRLPVGTPGENGKNYKPVSLSRQHRSNVSCVAFCPQRSLLTLVGPATNAGSPIISVWQLGDGPISQRDRLCTNSQDVKNCNNQKVDGAPTWHRPVVRFSPSGQSLAVVDEYGRIHVFKLEHTNGAWTLQNLQYNTRQEHQHIEVEKVVDAAWWGLEALAVARKGGQVTVEPLSEKVNLLGPHPELFEAGPWICSGGFGRLLVLEAHLHGSEEESDQPKLDNGLNEFGALMPWLLGTAYAPGIGNSHEIVDGDEWTGSGEQYQGWRLVSLVQRTPEQTLDVHLAAQEYGAALSLAAAYGLDSDRVYKQRWQLSDYGRHSIRDNLMRIHDRVWQVEECLSQGPSTVEAVAALLQYGLQLTNNYKEDGNVGALISEGLLGEEADKRLWWFRRQRLRLLQYQERLETYMAVTKGRFIPANYYSFRDLSVAAIALPMAQAGKCAALDVLFRRHGYSLAPHILELLDVLPELLPPKNFRTLLPGIAPPSLGPMRRADWVESSTTLTAIAEGRGTRVPASVDTGRFEHREAVSLAVCTEELVRLGQGLKWPSSEEVEGWYRQRAARIEEQTGVLELSVALLDLGLQKGFHSLSPLLEDMADMHAVVYGGAPALTLQNWQAMGVYERFSLLLDGVSSMDVVERLGERALPFLFRRASSFLSTQSSSVGERSTSVDGAISALLTRWLEDKAREGRLDICGSVLLAARQGKGFGHLLRTVEEVVEVGLRCCKACPSTDLWDQLEDLLTMLSPNLSQQEKTPPPPPVRDLPRGLRSALLSTAQDAKEAVLSRRTPPQSGGDGEARGSATELSSEVSSDSQRRVALAAGYVRAGRILMKYHVTEPMAFFMHLGSKPDEAIGKRLLQRLLAGFSRRQPPPGDAEWGRLWSDLCTLQACGLQFLSRERVLAEFCWGLLHAARFEAAKGALKELPGDKAEQLVLAAARNWFYSATSLASADVEKARECLMLLPDNEAANSEALLIKAITETLPNMGVELLPLQFRQMGDPMDLINYVLNTSPLAYRDPEAMVELGRQLRLGTDSVSVLACVARHAASQGDLGLASSLCLQLVRRGYEPVWVLCAALGRRVEEEGPDLATQAELLGFALAHCDEDALLPLLQSWRRGDMMSRCKELGLAASVEVPTLLQEEKLLTVINKDNTLLGSTGSMDESNRWTVGRAALEQVSGEVEEREGRLQRAVPKELLAFAYLQLPWLLTCCPLEDRGPEVEALRGQIAALVVHALASFLVPPSDKVLIDMATAVMGEGLRYGVSRDADSVGLGYSLHVANAGETADLLEREMERRKETGPSRRALAMRLFHCALQAMREWEPNMAPCEAQHLLQASPLELAQQLVRRNSDSTEILAGHEWALRAQQAEMRLRASEDARLLQELLPHADPQRFAARQMPYMEDMILSLVGQQYLGVADMLSQALALAEHYGIDTWRVYMANVETLLLSDWQTDEVEAEVASQEGDLLERPLELVRSLQDSVLEKITGTRHTRLAYCFSLLAKGFRVLQEENYKLDLDEDLRTALFPAGSTLVERLSAVKLYEHECLQLSAAAPELDFLHCVHWEGSQCPHALSEMESHMSPANIETLAGFAAVLDRLARAEPPCVSSSSSLYMRLISSLWMAQDGQTGAAQLDAYDVCRQYLRKLNGTDVRSILKQVVTDSLTEVTSCPLLWEAVVEDALELLQSESTEDDRLRLSETIACLRGCRDLLDANEISTRQVQALLEAVKPFKDCEEEGQMPGVAAIQALIASGCALSAILRFMEAVYGPWKAPTQSMPLVVTDSKLPVSAAGQAESRNRTGKRKGRGGGKLGVVRISPESGGTDALPKNAGGEDGKLGIGRREDETITEGVDAVVTDKTVEAVQRISSRTESNGLAASLTENMPQDLHCIYAVVADKVMSSDTSFDRQAVEGVIASLRKQSAMDESWQAQLLRSLRSDFWRRMILVAGDTNRTRRIRIQLLELLETIVPELDESTLVKRDRWAPSKRLSFGRGIGEEWGRWTPDPVDVTAVEDVSHHIGPYALLLLRSAEAVASLWLDVTLEAQDVTSVGAAEQLFLRLHETANSANHTTALLKLLDIWGEVLKGRGPGEDKGRVKESRETCESERGIFGESMGENTWLLHPLHRCWALVLPDLLLGSSEEGERAVGALEKATPHLSGQPGLLSEEDARDLLERLHPGFCAPSSHPLPLQSRHILAAKVALLLPYQELQIAALKRLQDGLREEGSTVDDGLREKQDRELGTLDCDLLLLLLAGGHLPRLAANPEYEELRGAFLRALGALVKQRYEQLPLQAQSEQWKSISANPVGTKAVPLFVLALPCSIAELTIAGHYTLASTLVGFSQRVHPALSLWGTALPLLARYLEEQLHLEGGSSTREGIGIGEAQPSTELLGNVLRQLEKRMWSGLEAALSRLAEDMG